MSNVATKSIKSSNLEAALELACAGWPVFPIWHVHPDGTCACGDPQRAQIGKHPRCTHGHNDATTDEAQIRRWWSESERGASDAWQCDPNSNVGIAIPEGVVIVDVDPRNGGEATLNKVCAEHGQTWLESLIVASGGGGFQVYLACEPGRRFPKTLDVHFGPGIDLKQCGGYVLAPPSNHKSGGSYSWLDGITTLAPAPSWLTLLSKVKQAPSDVAAPAVPDAAELDENLRERLDGAIVAIEPHCVRGIRHNLAVAIGGYLRNRSQPALAARYVVSQLPSADPSERVKGALWAYQPDVKKPRGASDLQVLAPELLAELDQIFVDRAVQRLMTKSEWGGPGPDTKAAWLHAAGAESDPEPTTPDERRTDLGNARRLVRMHRDTLRYCDARRIWYIWDGKRWESDETRAIERAAKSASESLWGEAINEPDDDKRKSAFAWAAKCQDHARIMNMIALAKSEPGVPVRVTDLDADPWLLNVQNGTLDLRTGELCEPDPALLMTKCCATHYEPGARSELWDAFIARTFGGDAALASYVQRALGYALFGAWREKAFWFGYGPPDGAKSTFLGAVGAVLGDYHVSADASTWMVQHSVGANRGDVTRLLGARFVTSLETRPGLKFDEALVKKVSGGDTIVAAAKYEGEIQFPPTFALWMGANDRPSIRDDDEGMWSRVRCVPFTNVVPKAEQDKELSEKLRSVEHAPAVLAWLVAGCRAWQSEGLGTCDAVTTATKDYRETMNRAAAFFEQRCELTGKTADEVPCKKMRDAYELWCHSNNVRAPLAPRDFGQRLRSLGVGGGDDASKHPVADAPKWPSKVARDTRDRHWTGVRLLPE